MVFGVLSATLLYTKNTFYPTPEEILYVNSPCQVSVATRRSSAEARRVKALLPVR
jgi:hypothetical protein